MPTVDTGIQALPKRVVKLSQTMVPLGVAVVCLFALQDHIRAIDLTQLRGNLVEISVGQWVLALGLTALSFLAVARYDTIAHRHFGTDNCHRKATLSGAVAIAISQTTGFGMIIASLIRWKLQPSLGFLRAGKITVFVTLCFFLCWSILTSAAWGIQQSTSTLASYVLYSCSITFIICILYCALCHPVISFGRHQITLPSLPALGAMFLFCLVDISAACAALYVLLPAHIDLSYAQLFPVFTLALGLALLTGAPGGIGAFEFTLLSHLANSDTTGVICAIIGFRVVYHAIPAAIALLVMFLSPPERTQFWPREVPGNVERTLIEGAGRAELGVLRQNNGLPVHCSGGVCATVRTGQTITALFDPLQGHAAALMTPLKDFARRRNRILCFYKVSPRHAAGLRQSGWSVLHIAQEALIIPNQHSLLGRAYRQLRRKLHQARDANVRIEHATDRLPWSDMAEVSANWEDVHGIARGLSMGRFEAAYLKHQAVFLAWQDTRLIGFVSFHTNAQEWCLDIMRTSADAPDGTMHSLIHQAIEKASKGDVPLLSLAAAPPPVDARYMAERMWRRMHLHASGGLGLRQFKDSFAPHWRPLYMATETWPGLALAALDLVQCIMRGQTLHPPLPPDAPPKVYASTS